MSSPFVECENCGSPWSTNADNECPGCGRGPDGEVTWAALRRCIRELMRGRTDSALRNAFDLLDDSTDGGPK
jgi:hypothetical protein